MAPRREVTVSVRKSTRDSRPPPPIVLYAPLGELKVYELSEAEFEQLSSGPTGQLHLNFALAMLPTALTILITLQTVDIVSNRLSIGYQVAFWALAVQGVISLLRWWYSNRAHDRLIQDIRARMPKRPVVAEQILPNIVLSDPEPPQLDGGSSPSTIPDAT